MKKITPEAMRVAMRLGNALVARGSCRLEDVSAALDFLKRGNVDGANFIIARAVGRSRT